MISPEIFLDKDFKLSYPILSLRIVKRFGFGLDRKTPITELGIKSSKG